MPHSNFAFLKSDWPDLFAAAREAEQQVQTAPRSCLFSCRYALEQATHWLYAHDDYLKRPYSDKLGALIYEPTFRENMPPQVFAKVKVIHTSGNLAVHSGKQLSGLDAFRCLKELFHFLYWLYRSYSEAEPQEFEFRSDLLPVTDAATTDRTQKQILALKKEMEARDKRLEEEQAAKAAAQEELAELKKQIHAAKERNAETPDTHDYSEAETRSYIIDLLLREAGWDIDAPKVREFPVEGMPSDTKIGRVDYVLWGDDGKPLAVVEAKRTTIDAKAGRQQAKLYADCLEKQFGRRPFIFYTNGYETYFWDDTRYPQRLVQGFHKKPELEMLMLRRTQARKLANVELDRAIAGRPYQEEGIRRVTEHFQSKQRKALVVMATGTGKTRFAIALSDILQRAGWAKRILFLADRNALVRQAKGAFLAHMPNSNPVDIRTAREDSKTARVVLSTYPTMMSVIDEMENGERRFGIGHFDLIIIDEAHRSVYQKYRAIFEYFDSVLLGLTATPRDEVDRNTYSLFELENGVPTYHFELDEAVADGWLVPPTCISVPLKFQREGIKYDELSDDEKTEFEATFWDKEGNGIREVDKGLLNKWLFNQDTVDKVLKFLLEKGLKVEGGDRLGKTIIFAANHRHAEFIQERFDRNFPAHAGHFARVIDSHDGSALSLLDDFTERDKNPHIAISVDMLDTGVDVPEILNLVFFKRVYSKVKFHQMIGRGTRTCEDLFAPGEHKKEFLIFDFCENFEFFNNRPKGFVNTAGEPLHQRVFRKRLNLLLGLDKKADEPDLQEDLRTQLYQTVSGMNLDSFMIRPTREYVERYADLARWESLTQDDVADIMDRLSGLPSDFDEGDAFCRGFDLLILNAQTELLNGDAAFLGRKTALIAMAGALARKRAIPQIAANMDLLEAMQDDAFWAAPSCGLLEQIRLVLRELVRYLDKDDTQPVYTNFTDTIGEGEEAEYPGNPNSMARYRMKVQQYLREHQDHITIHKLRMNKPITGSDIKELERMLDEAEEVGGRERFSNAFGNGTTSLGSLIRNLVGLDRTAAQAAFAHFLEDGRYTANQIHFVGLIIDHLTQTGTMDPKLLFESSPFTDEHASGVAGVFPIDEARKVVECLQNVNGNAVA
jgi:type I restriction enzyme R subunit